MKEKSKHDNDEFYVGYLPQAPQQTASFVQRILIGIGICVVLMIALVVLNQKEFSKAVFEYQKLRVEEGFLFKAPVPHLKVPIMDGSDSVKFHTILLVGFGKAGAGKTISQFEKITGPLERKRVQVKGHLIHGNSQTLMEIADQYVPVIVGGEFGNGPTSSLPVIESTSLFGEIVDPKCYFGVMKPGEGKPHRSCAIRCIAGGIPPVFHTDSSGDFIILGDDYKPLNQELLSIVGDHLNLNGKVVLLDDWKILLIERDSLKRFENAARLARVIAEMQRGITVCKMGQSAATYQAPIH